MPPLIRPEFPGESYHQNLSSPGRLGLHTKDSDSSLQLQYGTRVKRAQPLSPGGSGIGIEGDGGGAGGILGNNGFGTVSTNGGQVNGGRRISGTGAYNFYNSPALDQYNGYNDYGPQEILPQLQHENDPRHNAIRNSHGRLSVLGQQPQSLPQIQQQQQYSSPVFQPHQQYHPSQRFSSTPPTPIAGHREDDISRGDIRVPSLSALTIGVNDPSARYSHASVPQHNARYQQVQKQECVDPNFSHRPNSFYQNGVGTAAATGSGIIQSRQSYPDARTPRNTTGVAVTAVATPSAIISPTPRVSDALGNAGPLIDLNSSTPTPSSSNRALAADQVFARLAKQNPTNPRETDKREWIYKWMDDITKALTFNPDTSTPGWIIPVTPDELDQTDSPFYLDRITYELDLMAPIGRPLRRVIDINCASGGWAMDLALKYPRTIVYAIDPGLEVSIPPQRIPENCRFKLRDVKDQEGEFDFVHQRLGAFRIPILEWTPHFAELGRLTRPGGWIQLAECNGMIMRAGVESLKVNRWVEKAALSTGLNPMQMVDALMPTILGAGLINVECYEYGIPLGEWAGGRGVVAMRSYLAMVESLRVEIIEFNRLEEGIFEETIELMKMECLGENAELIMKVICAQKPPFSDDIWR
ncbi:hypothetical protein BGZ49_008451 [Haplosporangium sp. Z 27]|nr:hypothetical protein BGZ49_008451 [Haplosporangium sp. Z 27]